MLTSTQKSLVVVGILFSTLATVAVLLRLWSRRIRRCRLGNDDWSILLGLLFAYVNDAIMVYAAFRSGFGAPAEEVQGQLAITYGKTIFARTISWEVALSTVKVSILLLYRRIFVTKGFRLAVDILIAVTLLWMVANVIAFVFAWTPVSAAWTREGRTSYQFSFWLIGAGVTTAVLDFVTLFYPLFPIRKLSMSRKRKVLVSSMFLLGSVSWVASFVRLAYFVRYHIAFESLPPDESGLFMLNYIPLIVLWSSIEIDVGIIAACLPTYAALISDKALASIVSRARSMVPFQSRGSDESDLPRSGDVQMSMGVNGSWSPHRATFDSDRTSVTFAERQTQGIRKDQHFSVTYVDQAEGDELSKPAPGRVTPDWR